jgi:hypothetical protein
MIKPIVQIDRCWKQKLSLAVGILLISASSSFATWQAGSVQLDYALAYNNKDAPWTAGSFSLFAFNGTNQAFSRAYSLADGAPGTSSWGVGDAFAGAAYYRQYFRTGGPVAGPAVPIGWTLILSVDLPTGQSALGSGQDFYAGAWTSRPNGAGTTITLPDGVLLGKANSNGATSPAAPYYYGSLFTNSATVRSRTSLQSYSTTVPVLGFRVESTSSADL